MGKKQYFLVVDTETTIKDHVVDFGAAIVDRKGEVFAQCGVMVAEYYKQESLFNSRNETGIFSTARLAERMQNYDKMIESGSRMVASVNAINRWLEKAAGKYNPELTAYNLSFDTDKCKKTGIDLNPFPNRFCLWQAAVGNICKMKTYREFVLENHLFNNVTEFKNMTFSTNAESVAGFLNGEFKLEPHTALEDIIEFEIPILRAVLKKRGWREKIEGYNWRNFQVKDHFNAKA